MDEAKDQVAPYIDQNPDAEARVQKALEIRKAMGIYGKGGQSGRGFWKFAPLHAQAIFEYCFGIVWAQPLLNLKQREIIVISALAANNLEDEVEWHIRSGMSLGLTRDEIIEVLTTLSPYIGLPRTNHAFKAALRAFEKADRENGIEPVEPPENDPDDLKAEAAGDQIGSQVNLKPDLKDRINKAFEVRQKIGIYGTGGQGNDGFYKISKAHNQAIFEYCFGMIWNQPLLDMKTKELIVIAASTSNQCDNELEWHVRSGLNAGLSRDEIIEAITQCSPYIGLSKTNQGMRAAQKAFDALDADKA
ncbi:MAG: carboxymuconolactone decarboxylase family protein [Nitrospinaceae bacterium]|jgi:4-carboxymuconolactone decarboxylase|nr:carboxymuconolactone decarboxylase family protein [Nitrospinaceae bacterium]MBT3434447.1 carboxymuconolactone decarboxylase family protein [Nitrospinaceae bacterium]MBT3822107.1 carboxymuconolactone decarboxylase family protein [Nitrospinaceae bacterium]MBT4092568.1 carboxymuconolactone decarboxylase family protein [Nitrospinaceae bacterium]MBT4428885.1 carboxymuconolactone decarboxylase family protein [Nitrospinaceae bacterium]